MIKLLNILVFFSFFSCYSQSTNVEKLLIEKFPVKESFKSDGIWMFYPDMGNIKKIDSEYFKLNNPNLELYQANLTNFLDEHITETDCVIIYDTKLNSVKLVPPLWYEGFNKELWKLFLGVSLSAKNDKKELVKEIQKIIIIGSEMHIGKTKNENTKVMFEVVLNDHKDAWRDITLIFDNNKLINIQAVNPSDKSLDDEAK